MTVESLHAILSRFLADVFNEFQRAEEACLSRDCPDLSLRELHLIERVCRAVDGGLDNRSTAIAAAQHVTAGTLTTAVNLLERKGFLRRERDGRDKRVVRLYPTERARAADARHAGFHRELADGVLDALTGEEADTFVRSLERVADFFRNKCPG